MIKFYSKENCEKCTETKEYMKSKGIDFQELPLNVDDNLVHLAMNGVELSSAPVIEKDGKFYTNTTGLMRALR